MQLPGASLTLPYYPRDFVDPKTGLVFMAGERIQSRWLDVDATGGSGRGRWDTGPNHIWGFNRDYGSAVMYDDGKILYVGGGGYTGWDTPDPKSAVPTATAEKIDLMAGPPTWTSAGSMAQPRRHLNATVLPDGTVLVTGGVSGGGFNDLASAVHTAELWDPATNDWTPLAPNTVNRGYHCRVAAVARRYRPPRRERRRQHPRHQHAVPARAEPRDLPSAVPVPRCASRHQHRRRRT